MKIALALAAVLVTTGCATDATPGPGPEPRAEPAPAAASDGAEGLALTTARPERVAGTFVDPRSGAELVFDSTRDGDQLALRLATGDGRVLVEATTLADAYRFSYLGGRLTLTVERAWVEAVQTEGEDGPAAQDERALHWDGDQAVLDEMLTIRETSALPWMSRALGVRGVTGAAFPASLVLHKLARQSADALAVEVPPLVTAADNVFCSRPTANECYGMCGPGCTCWSWVCGNCCYHYGCARHDSWCRSGQWYYCYNITAVIALFGC